MSLALFSFQFIAIFFPCLFCVIYLLRIKVDKNQATRKIKQQQQQQCQIKIKTKNQMKKENQSRYSKHETLFV